MQRLCRIRSRGAFGVTSQTEIHLSRGPRVGAGNVASQTAHALFHLRATLLRGEFAPGERMSELPLVARLGVSRTPIRLALERLAHMGLLDVSASGGFTVRGYTPSEALDAIEIRGSWKAPPRAWHRSGSATAPSSNRCAALAARWNSSSASRWSRSRTTWI